MVTPACSGCGAAIPKGARFCRSCGASTPTGGADTSATPVTRRAAESASAFTLAASASKQSGRRPPWIAVAIFALAAAVIALVVVLMSGPGTGTPHRDAVRKPSASSSSSAASSSSSTSTTSDSVTTSTPIPNAGANLLLPNSGWIAIVESLASGTNLTTVYDDANAKRARGFGPVNVLGSSTYPSLAPNLWLEYLGPFDTRTAANAACADLVGRGLVAPDGSDCYTKGQPLEYGRSNTTSTTPP